MPDSFQCRRRLQGNAVQMLLRISICVLWEVQKTLLADIRECRETAEDLCMWCGSNLDGALIYLEDFAPDREKDTFESKIKSMFDIKPELRFHDLRHNFASHLAMIGIPVTTAAKILGHSSISTTQNIYQHTNTDEMRTAMIAATGRIKCQNNLIGSELGLNHISPKMEIPQTPVA